MDEKIKAGLKNSMKKTVLMEDTAGRYASGTLDVFATPALAALMENTARSSVDGYLPEGYTTVGTEINLKHIKATPVGMNVTCESILEKIDGKKLYFKVDAWDEKGKIGEGFHVRYIVNTEHFLSKII